VSGLDNWKITPTEELLLEVLIARTRLGHIFWTIARNSTSARAVFSLARKGFVIFDHGNVPGTFRAELTEEAKKFLMSNDYLAPIQGGPK
jgi:hypothetical protein